MKINTFHRRTLLSFVAGLALAASSGWAAADPPSRVARLGYMSGAVSFSPAGQDDWIQATLNRPLSPGDRLWADPRGRAEVQVGGAMLRMNASTSVSLLNLDDHIAQLQLTQGSLNVRVRRLDVGQSVEVDTPNLAFTVREPGDYRIDVDPDGASTTVIVRKGQGEAYGDGASYVIDTRQAYRFRGTGLRDYELVDAPRSDDFDRWAGDRDRAFDNSATARYVSPDVVGYQDLDDNGSWRNDPVNGNVWFPSRVASGWAPYHDGHWAWVDPWGWTWVDDAPWGYAVSHYGRWANMGGRWGWVPGPVQSRAYYAPALVAFVGGANFQLSISSGNVGGVAWFPLAPREVYRPSYPVSRGYFENINRSNTVVNNTVINNTYNNVNVTNITYANRQVPGAVVAVPRTVFVQSQPVARAVVQVTPDKVGREPVGVVAAPVAPTVKNVRGNAPQGDTPPARVFERPVIAHTAPPPAPAAPPAMPVPVGGKPGALREDNVRKEPQPALVAPVRVVNVVKQAEPAPHSAPPPVMAASQGGATGARVTLPAAVPPTREAPPPLAPASRPGTAGSMPAGPRDAAVPNAPREAAVPIPPREATAPREAASPTMVARPPVTIARPPAPNASVPMPRPPQQREATVPAPREPAVAVPREAVPAAPRVAMPPAPREASAPVVRAAPREEAPRVAEPTAAPRRTRLGPATPCDEPGRSAQAAGRGAATRRERA